MGATSHQHEGRVQHVQRWILDHLAGDLTLKTLAGRSSMSVRHFTRVFQKETGTTAGDYVEIARVAAAQQLLKDSDLQLRQIATACGFANSDIMRRVFLRRLGTKPSLYRVRARSEAGG